jgi:tRNA (guanine-N7-)-methyltransferase
MSEHAPRPSCRIRSYVLRGRMTPAQRKTYENLKGSQILVPPYSAGLSEVFPQKMEAYIVEIGFGMGKSTALMAGKNPAAGYIGIEVHAPGVARLLWEIKNRGLENIRIVYGDAFPALRDMIPPDSIDGVHIFFPDPWPKKRHHKRRLLTADFLRLLASRLKTGGYLYIVTDWQDYAGHIAETLNGVPELEAPENAEAVFPWRPETAFEKKGRLAGRKITEIYRIRRKDTE